MTDITYAPTVNVLQYHGNAEFDWMDNSVPGEYRAKEDVYFALGDLIIPVGEGWVYEGVPGAAIDEASDKLAAWVLDRLYDMIKRKLLIMSYWEANLWYYRICVAQKAGRFRSLLSFVKLRCSGWMCRMVRRFRST